MRGAGLSDEAIEQAAASGRLLPLFRATYALGREPDYRGRTLGAVLACGEGSVVSHGTAACLLNLWEFQPLEVDVIAPCEAGRKIDGIRRRFAPAPRPSHVIRRDGIPCTSFSRTLVDMAGILKRPALAGVVEQAAVLQGLDVPEVEAILAERSRRGARRLHAVLEPWRRYSPRARIRSRMEARLLPLLTLHGLSIPHTNSRLRIGKEVFEVDFLWQRERVVVETDGGQFHDNPVAAARDGHRNRVLAQAGYKVPRVGWSELTAEPERTIAEIRRFLRPAVP